MKHYSVEDLRSIYESLYAENEVAADEDYLEEYEANYSPDNLSPDMSIRDLVIALRGLVSELMDDTGDESVVRGWLSNAGAEDDLVDVFFGGVSVDDFVSAQTVTPIRRVAIIRSGAVRDVQFCSSEENDPGDDDSWHDLSSASLYLGVFSGVSEEEILQKAAVYGYTVPSNIVLIDVEQEPAIGG